MRELACQVVAYTIDCPDKDALLPLLKDHSADIRMSAVQVIGSGDINDPNPYVAISAARALTIQDGQPYLKRWLEHPNRNVRYCAAGALASTGTHGLPLMMETMAGSEDPYIRINIAIGLIGQRKQCADCADILYRFLTGNNDRIMWEKKGMIRYLSPSSVKTHPFIPNRPELVNQSTRLELLNMLAVLEDPRAPEAARRFLQARVWGISGMTAELLLSEGDENAIESVETLLNDPNPRIRVQAALILAFWEKSDKTVEVLQDAYSGADRETKEKILESLGTIGSETSVPFLVEAMEAPSQTMRIIAASSLIKCLYH